MPTERGSVSNYPAPRVGPRFGPAPETLCLSRCPALQGPEPPCCLVSALAGDQLTDPGVTSWYGSGLRLTPVQMDMTEWPDPIVGRQCAVVAPNCMMRL